MTRSMPEISPEALARWLPLRKKLASFKSEDKDWEHGRVPGYTYKIDDDLDFVIRDAFMMYWGENALGQKAFSSVKKIEEEVISFGLDLFGHPGKGDGIFTSGGTESIFLAVKAAREWARKAKPHVSKPQIVLPQSGHACIDKAAHLLGLEASRVPIQSDFRADVNAMERAVTPNTVMILGSAPAYTHGNFDDIAGIGSIAKNNDLWFHVDACFGGFVSPFWKRFEKSIPEFDFSIPTVRSLSADLHKYGYAPKGASMVLFRDKESKEYARYLFRNWPRGLYHTYTFQGSRAAGPLAGAWAVINFLGKDGYIDAARRMLEIKKRLIEGVRSIRGLRIIEPNDLCIFCFDTDDPTLEINAIADGMRELGWFIGTAAEPMAIIFAINPIHAQSVDSYLSDLEIVVDDVRKHRKVSAFDEATY